MAPRGDARPTAPPPSEPRLPLRAALLALFAFACFAALDTTAKHLQAVGIPLVMVIWARYTGHVVFALATLRRRNVRTVWASVRPRLQVLRGLLLFGSTCFNFAAVRYLQLTETAAINFAIPLIVAALAVPVLGERIGIRRWSAIVVGFLGVLVIVRPTPELFQPAALLSLGSATCAAGYVLTTRILAQRDHHETTNAYAALVGAILTLPLIPFVWVTPVGLQWLLLALTGIYGAVGHYVLTAAHEHAPAPLLAPFWYSQILYVTVLGFLVFGDVPDRLTVVGALIVLGSGLYVWWRERVKRRIVSQDPPPVG